MKKNLWIIITTLISVMLCTLCLFACGGDSKPTDTNDPPPHTSHIYVEQVDDRYIKSGADCTHKAVYYKSCSVCNESSNNAELTFEYGELGNHSFTAQTTADEYKVIDADCTHKAVYYKSCSVCGEAGTQTFEYGEEPSGHDFTVETATQQYKASDATCTHKAVYYKSCSVCGAKGTESFEYGELGNHLYGSDNVCTICSQHILSEGLRYTVSNGTAYVSGIGTCTETDIYIADSYGGYPVTSIEEDAFRYCSSLTSITIPDSVMWIGDSVFSYCSSLTSITIPDSVMWIGDGVFTGCNSLQYNEYNNAYYLGNESNRYVALIKSKNTNITSCNINDNTKLIANYAFSGCSSLTSISIPGNVTSIGKDAFYNCHSLTSVTIGNSVMNIGNNAFSDCSSLTSVTIGNSVTSIGKEAFYNCSNLTSITIPHSVTWIGSSAFAYCSSLTIYCEVISEPSGWGTYWNESNCPVVWDCNNNEVATDGNIYTVIDGIRYAHKNGKATVAQQSQNIKDSIVIPASVTYKNTEYSVTSIGYRAFSDCRNLTSVTIPDSVTWIGSSAFYGCRNLTSITIPDSVTSIGSYAFYGCRNLTSITIPDSVTSIGSYAFYGCRNLTSITIPNSVTSIGDSAFKSCSSLTIYCEVTSEPSGWYESWNENFPVVWDCNNNEVATDGNIYTVIDGIRYALKDGEATVVRQSQNIKDSIVIPASVTYKNTDYSVTSIVDGVFYGCSGLTSVTIPDSVTSIGEYAFYGCSGLTSVTIPDSVTSIGEYAFYGCSGLTSVTIPDSVTSIGEMAFVYCSSLTSITIPDSVTSIGYNAFRDCSSLTIYCEVISEPSGWYESWNSNLPVVWDCQNNEVATDGNIYTAVDGVRYALNDGKATVVRQPQNIRGSIVIPASVSYKNAEYSVTSIGEYAFSRCSNLTSITIGNSVTSIGDYAFSGCSGLTCITIPDSVTSIGSSAFERCNNLTCITIGNSVTSIGSYAFAYCSGLTCITIPDSVTSIGSSAFERCYNLTCITIPDSVTSIGSYAFAYCSGLTCITFQDTKEQWRAISKSSDWNYNTGNYTVHCTNGDIGKDGTEL